MSVPRTMSAAEVAAGPVRRALLDLCARVRAVGTEQIPWSESAGRVLAERVRLDRPSPACDVSAMDGYAVRIEDLRAGVVPVSGSIGAGERAPGLPAGAALRIFTGAMVPAGAETVIPRELVREETDRIRVDEWLEVRPGQHIRRRGENATEGTLVCEPGLPITPPRLGAIASCGHATVCVHRRVRVGVIVTGSEVRPVGATPAPWELRDGNGPALMGMLAGVPWLDAGEPVRVEDRADVIRLVVAERIAGCDALLLTGGVSAGDHDYVPGVLRGLGFDVVFHKLPIRPGKPVLGAVDPEGRPVLGLPGNPVSVMVTARLFGAAALRARAWLRTALEDEVQVESSGDASAPPSLRWFPAVRLVGGGRAELVASRGSGDWVAAGRSDGFVEVPPGESVRGVRRFRRWRFGDVGEGGQE